MPFKKIKRAFKKITKPVAKVLDKVVPNEIKPFLPYAAAIAPYAFGPGVVGASGFQGILANPIARASLAGGLNLGAQLAQEGSEGEFSGISTLLAGLQGFGTAAGADQYLQNLRTPMAGEEGFTGLGAIKSRAIDIGQKGVDILQGAGEVLRDPFNQGLGDIAKAGAIPFTQGSIDLGMATARKALRDYELELDAFNAQAGANQAASDADRRAAIIASMTRANFTQDIIDETLGQLGLKDGGRVGFDNGGDVEGKIDLMGDLSKEDKKTFAELKKLLFDATIKDRPGYAQNMLEVANPFDDKDADSRGSQERARAFDRGNKRLIYGIISTKNDPEGREKFVEEFTENYENMMYPAGRMAEGGIARLGFDNGGDVDFGGIKEAIKGVAQNNMEEGVTQMYVSDSAGVIPLKGGDAVTGKTMDMMVSGFIEPYTKNDFRDPDGYERFMNIFSEFKETKMKKDKELNEEGMKKGGIANISKPKRGLVDEPGGYAGMKFSKSIMDEYKSSGYEGSIEDYISEFYGEEFLDPGMKKGGLASLKDGGIMDLGGKEMDMRGGGFIPIGAKERADDVPARLSKNEFVMTADAVRAAGGGSVNKGAKRMYDLMHNLEARA